MNILPEVVRSGGLILPICVLLVYPFILSKKLGNLRGFSWGLISLALFCSAVLTAYSWCFTSVDYAVGALLLTGLVQYLVLFSFWRTAGLFANGPLNRLSSRSNGLLAFHAMFLAFCGLYAMYFANASRLLMTGGVIAACLGFVPFLLISKLNRKTNP